MLNLFQGLITGGAEGKRAGWLRHPELVSGSNLDIEVNSASEHSVLPVKSHAFEG